MGEVDFDKVIRFIREEDVKFIRLAFFDIFGVQKNISIVPGQLERAFRSGISFDASAIPGFDEEVQSDLFLKPDASTLSILPWRPSEGRVARMFCDIFYPDGRPFEKDSRYMLKRAVEQVKQAGYAIHFGVELEFYLFQLDEEGLPTKTPFDQAGYMDIAPKDKGENVRREICFYLNDMGIEPESSHHSAGPGQNEIDFHYGEALCTADNASTLKWIIRTTAAGYGLHADLTPKPLEKEAGNGLHINISIDSKDQEDVTEYFMAGILKYIREITMFLNPSELSYLRFGEKRAPKFITWSYENRSQLIRIPASPGNQKRIELRSPDPDTNPYLAFTLLIYAGLEGIKQRCQPQKPTNLDLFSAPEEETKDLGTLPENFEEAFECAKNSEFVKQILPDNYLDAYGKYRH